MWTGPSPPVITTQPKNRAQTQVTDSLSTTLMLTITTLIQSANKNQSNQKNCEPMNKRVR
jgi:hypothetical protein